MRSATILFAASLLFASPALAQSPFDGTWKADMSSLAIAAKPDKILLKDGTYTCSTCAPAYSLKADGQPHSVRGKDYWDASSVTIVDDHTVKREFLRDGKVIAGGTETVSADGNTMTGEYWNTNNAAGIRETSASTTTRVGAMPSGAHAVSGDWKATPPTSASENSMQVTLKVTNDTVMMTSPRGETLNAKIGGGYAPNVGDPGKTMTKVAMPSPTTLVMTDMRGGRVVQTSTYTVSPDGQTLTGQWNDPVMKASGSFTAKKM